MEGVMLSWKVPSFAGLIRATGCLLLLFSGALVTFSAILFLNWGGWPRITACTALKWYRAPKGFPFYPFVSEFRCPVVWEWGPWKGITEILANDFSIASITMIAGVSLYALGTAGRLKSTG